MRSYGDAHLGGERSLDDVPARFVVEVPAQMLRTHLIPIIIAGSVEGRTPAWATYQKLLSQVRPLYEANADHYRRLQEQLYGSDDDCCTRITKWKWSRRIRVELAG